MTRGFINNLEGIEQLILLAKKHDCELLEFQGIKIVLRPQPIESTPLVEEEVELEISIQNYPASLFPGGEHPQFSGERE